METIFDIVNAGYKIEIGKIIQCIHGEHQVKIRWDARKNKINIRSRWMGFDTASECIEDMILTINKFELIGNTYDPDKSI